MRPVLLALLSSLFLLAGCGGNDWDDAWQTTDGEEVDSRIVSTSTGCPDEDEPPDEHDVVYLDLGWPLGARWLSNPERQYVRDPSGGIVTGSGPFDATAQLPESARSSGYRRGDAELWLGSDADEFVYLVFDDHAERWPRIVEPLVFGCG